MGVPPMPDFPTRADASPTGDSDQIPLQRLLNTVQDESCESLGLSPSSLRAAQPDIPVARSRKSECAESRFTATDSPDRESHAAVWGLIQRLPSL
jgi:hypothetical protein